MSYIGFNVGSIISLGDIETALDYLSNEDMFKPEIDVEVDTSETVCVDDTQEQRVESVEVVSDVARDENEDAHGKNDDDLEDYVSGAFGDEEEYEEEREDIKHGVPVQLREGGESTGGDEVEAEDSEEEDSEEQFDFDGMFEAEEDGDTQGEVRVTEQERASEPEPVPVVKKAPPPVMPMTFGAWAKKEEPKPAVQVVKPVVPVVKPVVPSAKQEVCGQKPAEQVKAPEQRGLSSQHVQGQPKPGAARPVQSGQRPAQNGVRPGQSQRPTQQRPVQNGQRPVQSGTRPVQQGQRPAQKPVRPQTPVSKPAETTDYSGMTAAALWAEVRKWIDQRNLAKTIMQVGMLEAEFGKKNISRLINQGYLISLGGGSVAAGR